ncbi:MAG: UDP-3-O-(3-hydroxymyristoyl)glucosamine N-acyltransferase [Endomicrobia bacterium]|nr:UDP-3-O-(3-hydroxymyristoyl)glucosamine N-acyltransferase [Endomicrobiia bacterium]
MNFTLKEIAKILDGKLLGDGSIIINNINDLQKAQQNEICFIRNKKYYNLINTTKASAIVVGEEIDNVSIPQVIVDDVDISFIKFLNIVYSNKQNFYQGIHPTVIFGENVKLYKNVSIGPYCVISDNVEIKEHTVLTSFVFVGSNTKIGSNTIIYPQVSIREDVVIGSNVIIHSGTVIGSDGFGYIQKNGKHLKIPHIGKVVIEDDVEIGANVTIDRGTISETRIKKGTKIDNLVHIAHNVEVGENVLLLGQVGIAGSSKIGNNTILAGQTGVIDHINVGSNVVAGPRTGILQNVDDNEVIWGIPSIPFEEQKKIAVACRKLPKLLVEFAKVKKELQQIKQQLEKLKNNL